MMQRIWLVANRDFTATVSSKGFLIGLLVMPILIVLFVVVGPRILSSKSPHVVGQIAVIDPTGITVPVGSITAICPTTWGLLELRMRGPTTTNSTIRMGITNSPIKNPLLLTVAVKSRLATNQIRCIMTPLPLR